LVIETVHERNSGRLNDLEVATNLVVYAERRAMRKRALSWDNLDGKRLIACYSSIEIINNAALGFQN
jgi:hypothetical protein